MGEFSETRMPCQLGVDELNHPNVVVVVHLLLLYDYRDLFLFQRLRRRLRLVIYFNAVARTLTIDNA